MQTRVTGQFVDGAQGRILLVCHWPASAATRAVIVLPPLAEEMNKARRLLWAVGQALAAHGIMTVIPDLYGTGDSEGDFADAAWDGWASDIETAVTWARQQGADRCDALLVRLGACLYASCAPLFATTEHRVAAWQPEASGQDALKQLLRLKVMSDRVTWGRKSSVKELQSAMASSGLEIGGYRYSAELAQAIGEATFDWAELDAQATGADFNWTAKDDEQAPPRVWRVPLQGQRFWTAVEPGPHAELVSQTADFFAEAH